MFTALLHNFGKPTMGQDCHSFHVVKKSGSTLPNLSTSITSEIPVFSQSLDNFGDRLAETKLFLRSNSYQARFFDDSQ